MSTVDWLAIEGDYLAGKKSVNSIAKEYGTSESTIRSRAKRLGWVRDPAGQQREKVKAHFAGVAKGIANNTIRDLEIATARIIRIEELALSNAEMALMRIYTAFESDTGLDSGDIKRLSESNKINLDTARTIFSLNETGERPGIVYDDAPFPASLP